MAKRIVKIVLITAILIYVYVSTKYLMDKISMNEIKKPLWCQNIDFETASISNETGTPNGCYIVPNYVHFIRFNNPRFSFVEMICVLAVFKNQKPDKIIFHRNHNITFTGPYWEVLSGLKEFMNIVEFNNVEEPTEIFDQPIEPYLRKFHGSDITRIKILMKYGGIFIDNDSYIINSLDDFRRFEMTLNWDENQYMGTQLLIAHKDARFLKLWLESYRGAYRTDLWYYNAGERPTTEILWKHPHLVHRVKIQFGADVGFIIPIFQEEWTGWRNQYAVHLMIHHQRSLDNLTERATFPVEFDELNIGYYPITFKWMAYDVYDVASVSWSKD